MLGKTAFKVKSSVVVSAVKVKLTADHLWDVRDEIWEFVREVRRHAQSRHHRAILAYRHACHLPALGELRFRQQAYTMRRDLEEANIAISVTLVPPWSVWERERVLGR